MKKRSLFFTCLLLAVTMIMVLCGCSTYGKVLSAYKDAGYTEEESVPDAQKSALTAALGEDAESVCTIHVLTRTPSGLTDLTSTAVVVIAEFSSTKAMEEEVKNNENLQTFLKNNKDNIEELQTLDIVSGTCVLIVGVGTDAYSVFKSTK